MLKEIRLPELSDNVTSADVVKVLVALGDTLSVEQPLLEVETEKAVFEFPSPLTGQVKEILVSAGETVAVGQALFRVEVSGAASEAKPRPALTPEARPEKAPAPAGAAKAPGRPPAPAPPPAPREEPEPHPGAAPLAAPSVRKLARELGVDIRQVRGFGPGGRLSAEDVKRFAAFGPGSQGEGPSAGAGPSSKPLPDFSRYGAVRREPMSKVRRITAEAMSAAALVPQVTQSDRADATSLEAFRARHAARVERAGGKLTVTAVLVKVCAEALRRFPQFNASVDMAAGEVVYKEFVNVGIAVDTERGLLVPVVKGADRKSLTEVAAEVQTLAEKARGKKITPEELEGGTFTISNLGGIGGTGFTPIVYPPQVAILGVSRTRVEPAWDGERFVPKPSLPLDLTYDHRLIDGADGARFLRFLCEALEDPFSLWL